MPHPTEDPKKALWVREELLHLLSLSGNLAGLCITGVALFHTLGSAMPQTVADDLLAISAVVFLIATYAIFFALRTRRPSLASKLEYLADVLVLLGLTGMITSGLIMVYTVW